MDLCFSLLPVRTFHGREQTSLRRKNEEEISILNVFFVSLSQLSVISINPKLCCHKYSTRVGVFSLTLKMCCSALWTFSSSLVVVEKCLQDYMYIRRKKPDALCDEKKVLFSLQKRSSNLVRVVVTSLGIVVQNVLHYKFL